MSNDFKEPKTVMEFGRDIQFEQLKSHHRRVLVSKEFTFDASHHLYAYEGKCKNLHGHTYKVVFGISSFTDDRGLAIDFGEIKELWKRYLEPHLDHRYLNETLPPMNTTAENICDWLFGQMDWLLNTKFAIAHAVDYKDLCPQLEFVRLYETPTSYAEMRREWFKDE